MAATQKLNETKKTFLKNITSRCNASSPSVRNTTDRGSYISYSANLNNQSEYGAEAYLKDLGFESQNLKATGSSTHGDFSSDIYGLALSHPSGVRVTVNSYFGGETPKFNISVSGTEEQLQTLLSK